MVKDRLQHPAEQQGLIVVEELDSNQVDFVRVEKSLHSVGFFSSAPTKELSRTVVQVIRRPDGQRYQAKAIIEGVASLGLPTTADRDKYMAFMKIALDQRDQTGQLQNPVRFSGADMIKLLRLRKGGFHYDEINDWCKRMVATTITSEASIFLADRRRYASDTFHVFDRVILFGEEMRDGSRSEFYEVHMSEWQKTNLNEGYMLPLDFNAYLRLGRDIAKALFGHLSVWFYASKGTTVEKRYQDLCQLLNIRAYPHLSKARSVLQPSMDELIEIGYLSSWDLIRTVRGSDFKLVLSPGNRLLSLPTFSAIVNPEARAALEATLPSWVQELVKRGVVERKARQLALDVPDTQPVMDQVEYIDHLVRTDRRGKVQNPPGLYVWAIESNLGVPDTFETSSQRAHRARAAEALQETQRHEWELRQEYERFTHTEVDRLVAEHYPADKWDEAIKGKLKALRRDQPELFSRLPEPTRLEIAVHSLRASLRDSHVVNFESWSGRDRQMGLFGR